MTIVNKNNTSYTNWPNAVTPIPHPQKPGFNGFSTATTTTNPNVTTTGIRPGVIGTEQIAEDAITLDKLAPEVLRLLGGIHETECPRCEEKGNGFEDGDYICKKCRHGG